MDAGSVRITVDIDASTLGTRLSDAVHKAVAPALARAQADINNFTGKLGSRGGGGDPFRQANADLDNHMKKLSSYHGVLGRMNLTLDSFVAKTVLVSSALSTLTPIVGLLGGAIGVLGGGIGVAVGGISQLAAGMTALVPAIGGAVTALKIGFQGLKEGAKAYMAQFDDANKVLAAQVGNLMGPMLTAWQEVSSQIKLDFAQAMVPTFNNLGALLRELGPSLSSVGQSFAGVANTVTATLNGLAPQLNTILAGSKTLFDTIKPGVQTLTEGMVTMGAEAQKAMPAIAGAIRDAMGMVGTAMAQAAQTPAFQAALQGFAQIIREVGGLMAGLGTTMIQIGGQVGPVFAQLIAALGPALNQILLAFGNLATTVGPIFNQFVAALGPALSSVVTGLGKMGEIVGPTLIPLLNGLAAALVPLYEPLGQLGAKLATSLTALMPSLSQLLQTVIIPMSDLLPTFGSILKVVAEAFIAVGPAIKGLASAIGSIAQGLVAGLQPLIPVINQMAQMLQPVLVQLGQSAGQLLAQLLQIIATNWQAIMPQLRDAFNNLRPAIQQLFQAVTPLLPKIIELATQSAVLALKFGVDLLPVLQAAIPLVGEFTHVLEGVMPVVDRLLHGIDAMVTGIGSGIKAFVDGVRGSINELINVYNSTIKPILSGMHIALPWIPAPPDISPISAGTPTGVQVPTGGNINPWHKPNPPGWWTPGWTPSPQEFGLPTPYPNAPAQPFTPVAPDLKAAKDAAARAQGAKTHALSPEDLPLDVIATTPEQIGLLKEIRDLLVKTGNIWTPLSTLKDLPNAVNQIAGDLKNMLPASRLPPGSIPEHMGPFGTPIKAINPAWEAAATWIRGWGGTPENIIGENPIQYATEQRQKEVEGWQQYTRDRIDTWKSYEQQLLQQQQQLQLPTQQFRVPQSSGLVMPSGPLGAPMGRFPGPLPSGVEGLQSAIVTRGRQLGLTDTEIRMALGVGQLESNWQPTGFMGFGPEARAAGYDFTQNPMGAIDKFFSQYVSRMPPGLDRNNPQVVADYIWHTVHNAADQNYGPKLLAAFGQQNLQNIPLTPATAPGLPGTNIGTTGNPVPVWVVGMGPLVGTLAPTLPIGGGPGAGAASVLQDTGAVPSSPLAQQAAAIISQYFPQITRIGGSRPAGTAVAGTHDVGRAIDIMIPESGTPQGVSLGNQIRDFLQANAQQLGVLSTIWQNQYIPTSTGQTTGPPVTGHMDHIDVQFANGTTVSLGPGGGTLMPPGPLGPPTGPLPGPAQPGTFGLTGALPGVTPSVGGAIPVYVTNWPGQQQAINPQQAAAAMGQQIIGNILGPTAGGAIQGVGNAVSDVAGNVLNAIPQALIDMEGPRAPSATVDQLLQEGNPALALAAAAGLSVEDFTRAGGPGMGMITPPQQPGYDASGRLYSDTAALLDRTMSSLSAQLDAMRAQLVDLLNQVLAKVSKDVLEPIIKSAVQAAFSSLSDVVISAIGGKLGDAAAKPIAQATGDAVAQNMPSSGGGLFGLFDEGGDLPSGTAAVNLSGATERVLSPDETRMFNSGLLGGPSTSFSYLPGVSGNATAFGDILGLPPIGPLTDAFNMFGDVILSIIGVNIEIRDTLLKLSADFRSFRGDAFKVFEAQGRLLADTSDLIDRSLSTSQMVAMERARITQQIVAGVIKFVIDQIIIPIGVAIAQAGVSALASAAGTAVSYGIGAAGGLAGAPGSTSKIGDIAGSFVQSLISGVGNALINITAKIIQALSDAIIDVGTKTIFDYIGSNFGGFGPPQPRGQVLPNIMGKPLNIITNKRYMRMAASSAGFDLGGLAYGTGLMPKSAIEPERVLSPRETAAFERLVDALTGGKIGATRGDVTINAPFTMVTDGREGAEQAHDRLLALLS